MQIPACNFTHGNDMNIITGILFRQVHVIIVLIAKSIFKLEHTVSHYSNHTQQTHLYYSTKRSLFVTWDALSQHLARLTDGDRKQVGHG